jgi:hypothetical protein
VPKIKKKFWKEKLSEWKEGFNEKNYFIEKVYDNLQSSINKMKDHANQELHTITKLCQNPTNAVYLQLNF